MLKMWINCKCKLSKCPLAYKINSMKQVFSFIKRDWNISLGTLVLLALILIYGVTNQFIQVFHYDMVEQYIRFIERGYDLIRSPGFEWWDFNHYLGSSIFAYGYYFLFSPFWLIFAILPSKEMIPQAMLFVNVFKLWVLFLTTTYYFTFITKDKLANFVGSSIITFSAFTLGYYQYGFYTDALVFLPLVLVGVEKFLKDNKYLHLVLSVAVLAIVNVYLFMMFTAFTFLYTLFRYFVLEETYEWKKILNKAFKFMGWYLLGVLISAIIFWPNLQLLLQSSRMTSNLNIWHVDLNTIYRFITSLIMPVVDRNDFNPLISKYVSSAVGYSGGVAIYSLIITPLFLTQLLILKTNVKKLWIIIFYSFLVFVFLFPPLYVFLQGNSDTRWMLMLILLNAYTIVQIITYRKKLNFKLLFITAVIIGALLSLAYLYSLYTGLQTTRLYFDIAKRNIIVLAFIVFIYLLAVFFKEKKVSNYFYIFGVILDISLVLFNIFFNPVDSVSMNVEQFTDNSIHDFNVVNEIKTNDDSLYRIEVIQESGYNDSLSKDYLGMTFYSSVYNYEVDPYIHNQLASAGGWLVGNNTGKWLVKDLLGMKYWATDMYEPYSVPYGYEPVFAVEQEDLIYIVFKNKYNAPLAYTQSNSLNFDSWNNLNALDKSRALMDYVVTSDSLNTIVSFSDSITKLDDFGTDITIDLDQALINQVVYVSYPRSEEVHIVLYDRERVVKDFYSYEPLWSSVYSEVYFDKIEVHVSNLWGVPEEEFINTVFIQEPTLDLENWYQRITKDAFNLELGTNSFTITGSSSKDQYLVTSIAYDANWSVKVNGEKADVEKVNAGFIGFKIPVGDLTIEAQYSPKQVYQGGFVSLLGVVYLGYKLKKDKKDV